MNSSDLHVLFVTQSLELGGTEKQVVALADRLNTHRISCSIFTFQKDGALKEEVQSKRIRLYTGGLSKGDIPRRCWKIAAAQWKLVRCIREVKPTVLHAYLPLTTFLGAVAAEVAGVPRIIISKRALGTHQDRHPLLRIVDRLANALSDIITVNSKAVWRDTIQRDHVAPSKLRLIYNGIDYAKIDRVGSTNLSRLKRDLKIGANEKIILNVANYIPYKGHFDLLRAAHIVLREAPESKFLLVGEDRGLLGQLQVMAAELGIQRQALFLGKRQDIRELLTISHVSVSASHEEGFSNAILEAMAAGLPVVATDVGGSPEAVLEGITGWLVPPRRPDILASRILSLLKNADQASAFGQRGRMRIQKSFSMNRMVESHLDLYREKS
jgi:glycosyltransferase involved in cell wall biosynthesis